MHAKKNCKMKQIFFFLGIQILTEASNFINWIKKQWNVTLHLQASLSVPMHRYVCADKCCIATPALELLLDANHHHFRRKKVSETLFKLVHLKTHKQDIK